MSDDCEIQFLTEKDVCECETVTLKEIEARILKAEAAEKVREGDDRPRGRMKDCFFTVGCSKGWSERGNIIGSSAFAYGVAKAMAEAHQAKTGHTSGVISVRCITIE